jgi:pimeloyl-ACP methyl ester carboxylesterase
MAKKRSAAAKAATSQRKFDALPDTVDFRDAMYVPTLVPVPRVSSIDTYRKSGVPVLDQARDGACTGFALATVANYLLRVRGKQPDADEVSAWMLYAMAKRYDEWPGEKYDGSSARGAMKGWYKHGLCAQRFWSAVVGDPKLEEQRSADAIERPLGAYFRVNHRDLVAMHAALAEVGILFATGVVHQGWQDLAAGESDIPFSNAVLGGHAFAIVGYDRQGFWVQNSWGTAWGQDGLARLSYDDWLSNGSDAWVAALGAPVLISRGEAGAAMRAGAPTRYQSHVLADLKPHIITSRNDGVLDDKGDFGLTPKGLETLITTQMPAKMHAWSRKRVLLYAHGGLVAQDSAVQTVANNRQPLLDAEVYPLSFIWRSDVWSTIGDILQDALRGRRNEGALDRAKDFLLDRIDDTLEPVARLLGGKALWDEMKENAARATKTASGAAALTANHLKQLLASGGLHELHLVGHSAGAVFHAHLAKRLAELKVPIASVTLWAPACTIALFESTYRPLVASGDVAAFHLYTMSDPTERNDNCAHIYNKSLLYLVGAAFEAAARIPGIRKGTPLLGLERDVRAAGLAGFLTTGSCTWELAPGPTSGAIHHGDFDNDTETLKSTLRHILGSAHLTLAQRTSLSTRETSSGHRHRLRTNLDGLMRRP